MLTKRRARDQGKLNNPYPCPSANVEDLRPTHAVGLHLHTRVDVRGRETQPHLSVCPHKKYKTEISQAASRRPHLYQHTRQDSFSHRLPTLQTLPKWLSDTASPSYFPL